MKKFLLIPMMLLTISSMAACGDSDNEPENTEPTEQPDNEENAIQGGNGHYLVVYFSHTGKTERVANEIRTLLDCDQIMIVPQTAYPGGNAIYDRAHAEQDAIDQGTFPAINTNVESFGDYEIIFVGFPIWSNRIATPVQAFLHNHAEKLAGKQIALFASSGGSSIANSAREARQLVPQAIFKEETLLQTSFNQNRIESWLQQLGLNREPDNN